MSEGREIVRVSVPVPAPAPVSDRIAPADVAACKQWISHHSKSFYLSSLLLPKRVRHASWALYAFCRRADDAVDEATDDPMRRVEFLRRRLDLAYGNGNGNGNDIDRAFAVVARTYDIPRALPEALLAGMEMDARGTRYATLDDLYLYCFRVASTVGLMMTLIMGWSRDDAFHRAADLGIAMQLTNIARDVGEDARRGRVYLPDDLLAEHGAAAPDVLSATRAGDPIKSSVRKLLAIADLHYAAADRGVPLLPRGSRLAIASSRHIYAAIGADLAAHGHDSITRRAHTSLGKKLLLVARAFPSLFAAAAPPAPGPADPLLDRLLAEVGLDAAARRPRAAA
jgi:phytoene synthase